MTKSDWWLLFDKHQDVMRALVDRYHPTSGNKHFMSINAAGAEAVREGVCNKILDHARLPGLVRFDAAVQSRDADVLVELLNDAWFGMPESVAVRHEPGFFQLCDLCEPPDEGDQHDYDSAN